MGRGRCLLRLLPFAEAFVGNVRLDLDFAAECSAGATVVLGHPGCRPSPWFPAKLLQNDAINGNSTVLYGWSTDPQDGWTRATAVPAGGLTTYPCLAEQWQPGERGRGYDYLPSCEGTNCVIGCLVSDATACNRSRMELGEVCSVDCERDGIVELTCDALAWPEQRSVECLAQIVYCDELGNATNQSGCVDRTGGTTSTTVPQSKRYFQGCAELQRLADGVVGMPENQMVAGAYYLEIGVGDGKVAGFVDSSWDNSGEPQWLSTSTGSGPGYIGLAVRFLAKELAEIRFSWDGLWENGQQIEFSQYLIPVVVAEDSSWRVPSDAWLFLPPSIFYEPLTSRPFPSVCNFPLDFEMMAQPPVCRDGLSALGSLEECEEAGFYLGVLAGAIAGYFQGFPGQCFLCPECDNGDLFWNNATGADVTTETVRQAPSTGALCRRGSAGQGDNMEVVSTPTPQAEFHMASGPCPSDSQPIFNTSVCEAAALDLSLGFQTVMSVNWPTETSDAALSWPAGCFYCPLCDLAHLFLNDPEEGNNQESVSSTTPGQGPSQVSAATTTWMLCQNILEQVEPQESRTTSPGLVTLPVTTTADVLAATDPPTAQETTSSESTTLPIATAGIVYLGDVQCDNPYQLAVELQWWQDPNTLMLIGGGIAACCFTSMCLWFWGICHRCCYCLGRICCCLKRKADVEDLETHLPPPQEELIFFNPPPGWKPTKVPGLVL